jgi:type I restriction enzyme S subunit
VFDTITRSTFDDLFVALPPSAIVTSLESEVAPLYDLLLALLQESSSLAELRDYLLPRLLSGRVRVRTAHG